MYLRCKVCGSVQAFSKFYPKGGFITGPDNSGWWASNPELSECLNEFYLKHEHGKDSSDFGGYQYELVYDVPQEHI